MHHTSCEVDMMEGDVCMYNTGDLVPMYIKRVIKITAIVLLPGHKIQFD